MNSISKTVGARIRAYRLQQGFTQEELAERASLHNTYIGQAERGEKNLTIASLEKILSALNISFSDFFAYMPSSDQSTSIASECYELISRKSENEQNIIKTILENIDRLLNQ